MGEPGASVTRDQDGQWETSDSGKGKMPMVVVVGVALGVGCIGMVFCGGILAAIAIPNFLAMQLRAKRSEAPISVDAIRTAEKAYHAEWDTFTSVGPCPPAWVSVGREQIGWDPSWECYSQFTAIGWMPDALARCRYSAVAFDSPDPAADDFTVTSECDLDGDGVPSIYQATRAERATMQSSNTAY